METSPTRAFPNDSIFVLGARVAVIVSELACRSHKDDIDNDTLDSRMTKLFSSTRLEDSQIATEFS